MWCVNTTYQLSKVSVVTITRSTAAEFTRTTTRESVSASLLTTLLTFCLEDDDM